ncbi:MAG: hypothetical protein JSS09_01010 [Verrucomicrobia bacterium]|nr:hypothetical protein [Verrucomicrobiota bacterium]
MTTPVNNNYYVDCVKNGFNSYVKPALWSCGELGVRIVAPIVVGFGVDVLAQSLGTNEKVAKEIQGAVTLALECYSLKGYVAPVLSTVNWGVSRTLAGGNYLVGCLWKRNAKEA